MNRPGCSSHKTVFPMSYADFKALEEEKRDRYKVFYDAFNEYMREHDGPSLEEIVGCCDDKGSRFIPISSDTLQLLEKIADKLGCDVKRVVECALSAEMLSLLLEMEG